MISAFKIVYSTLNDTQSAHRQYEMNEASGIYKYEISIYIRREIQIAIIVKQMMFGKHYFYSIDDVRRQTVKISGKRQSVEDVLFLG